MPDALEPTELTEPVDVIAWLRALPVWTVLLSLHDPQRPRCWQVRPWYEYHGTGGGSDFTELVMAGSEEAYEMDDDEDMALVAAEAPFQLLWTPGGGS